MNISTIKAKVWDRKFLLPIIFILGTVLRLINTGTESLDFDEIYSVKLASLSFKEIVSATSKDFHPPMYYFLLHIWTQFTGNSEYAVRLLSVVFGIMGIWAIYLIAKFIFNETTALLASFLFAVSHLNIEFSQEARMYSLLVLLAISSMYFLLKLLNEQNMHNFTFFTIFNVLLLYTHVYSFFIIAAEYFYFATLYFYARDYFKKGLHWFLHAALVTFLLFAPWVFIFFRQFTIAQKMLWIPRASIWGFPESLVEYSGSFLLALILIPLTFLSFISIRTTSKEKHRDLLKKLECMEIRISFVNIKKVYFLLLWLLFPIILPFTVSQFLSPIFLVKYTIAACSAFILLAASGLNRVQTAPLKYILITALAVFSFLNFRNDWSVPTKERWKEAITYLNNSARPGDLIIFNAGVCSYLYNYYTRRSDIPLLSLEPNENQLNSDSLKSLLSPYVTKHERFWLVFSHSRDYSREIPKAMQALTDSTNRKAFLTNNRKYFFISDFGSNSFDLYLLKSYVSPDISIYFYEKKNNSFLADMEKKKTEKIQKVSNTSF